MSSLPGLIPVQHKGQIRFYFNNMKLWQNHHVKAFETERNYLFFLVIFTKAKNSSKYLRIKLVWRLALTAWLNLYVIFCSLLQEIGVKFSDQCQIYFFFLLH